MKYVLGIICILVLLITLHGFRETTQYYNIPRVTPTIPLNYCNPFTLNDDIPITFQIKHIEQPYMYGNIPYKCYLIIEWNEGTEIYTVDTTYCNQNECMMHLILDSTDYYDMILHVDDNLRISMRIPEKSIPSIGLHKCIETNSKVIVRMIQ